MRDDLPLRPALDAHAGDEDHPLDLRVSSFDPVQPGGPSRAWRIFSVGAIGACALGLGLGLMTLQGQAATAKAAASKSTVSAYRPIKAEYAPPDREQVARALEDSQRLMSAEGLSGLARSSIVCFDKLTREPAYGLMDYCLALDIYGAQQYAKVAGETAPASTYFGQGSVRRQTAVQALIAGQTDANSRLIDTNRMAGEVALKAQLAALGVPEAAPAVAEAPPTLTVAKIEEPPPPPPPPPEPAPAPVRPAPPKVVHAKAAPILVRPAKPAASPKRQVRKPTTQHARARVSPKLAKRATAAQPVRALIKRPAPPKPKVAARPPQAQPDPSWPDVLLTRLKSEESRSDGDLGRQGY
jgi:hypothetical protein